jgi:tRNA (guanine-N(7)-)-methyltransferase
MPRNTFQNIPKEIPIRDENSILEFLEILHQKYIVIDMGCGHGDFMIRETQDYPDKHFIGIEISRKRVFKTSSRLAKRNINNYGVIDGDGELALKLIFPEASVNEIHINFPDPWLRKRQWKNRIFKPSFLVQIIRVLKTGGRLHFVTDVEEYSLQVAEILQTLPYLANVHRNIIEKNLYDEFPTLFYKKMSPLRDINYICFEKVTDPA